MLKFNLNEKSSQFMKIITTDEKETEKLGKKTAKKITEKEDKKNDATVIALTGELGSGKTVFARGIAAYFKILEITSPTFVIMKKYEINGERFFHLYHIDLYRIKEGDCLSEMGFEKLLRDPRNLIVIEWPERLNKLPENRILIKFENISLDKRRVIFPENFTLEESW